MPSREAKTRKLEIRRKTFVGVMAMPEIISVLFPHLTISQNILSSKCFHLEMPAEAFLRVA